MEDVRKGTVVMKEPMSNFLGSIGTRRPRFMTKKKGKEAEAPPVPPRDGAAGETRKNEETLDEIVQALP